MSEEKDKYKKIVKEIYQDCKFEYNQRKDCMHSCCVGRVDVYRTIFRIMKKHGVRIDV